MALSVATVSFLAILPIFISTTRTVNLSSESNFCRSYLVDILAKIDRQKIDPLNSRGIIVPINNFGNTGDVFEVTNLSAVKDRFRYYGYFASGSERLYTQRPGFTFDGLNVANNGITLYTPLLLDGPVAYLNDLYHLSEFKETYKTVPQSLSPSGISSKFNSVFEIKLEPYLLATGAANTPSQPRFWIRPRNGNPAADVHGTQRSLEPYTYNRNSFSFILGEFPANMIDTHGIRVTVRGRLTNNLTNVQETCEHRQDYSYKTDYQNSLDFTSDVKGVRPSINKAQNTAPFAVAVGKTAPNAVTDETPFLSNKNSYTNTMPESLKTVFTNVQWQNNQPLWSGDRQRPLCSQNQTASSLNGFYISFRVLDILDKEPGAIPLCMDTSSQWLSGESGGWCTRNHWGNNAATEILYDWRPRQTGWVPCEKLKMCGDNPDRVETLTGTMTVNGVSHKYYEYRYFYEGVIASRNTGPHRRLWGCEMKFAAAAIDVAGNLIYPPKEAAMNTAFYLNPDNGYDSRIPKIREMNPKVYFKPPPCYTCDCKRCPKKGKGGFLGSFFKWIVIAIVSATMLGAFGDPTVFLGGSTLLGLCLTGGLGCEKDVSVAVPSNLTGQSAFTSCDGGGGNCRCGSTCQRRNPPAPKWVDIISEDLNVSAAEQYDKFIEENSCDPMTRTITKDGVTFTARLAYRNNDTSNSTTKSYLSTKVAHSDEIYWQQLVSSGGKLYYCTAKFQCLAKNWYVAVEDSFSNGVSDNGNSPPIEPITSLGQRPNQEMVGCFEIKTGVSVNWASTNFPSVTQPLRGNRACLEINFNRPPFNILRADGGLNNLLSYSDYGGNQIGSECSTDSTKSLPNYPTLNANPTQRIVGRAVDECGGPETFSDAFGNDVTFTLVTGLTRTVPVFDANGDPVWAQDEYGNLQFDQDGNRIQATSTCWKRCSVSENLPRGPLTSPASEMMYYENYDSNSDFNLPFCTQGLDKSNFDN